MKKNYYPPLVEILHLEETEIVCASGAVNDDYNETDYVWEG